MQTIEFNNEGGPIYVEVRCGYAQPGAYDLRLWEADVNEIVMKEEGNFINPDDDSYPLPIPNKKNNCRIVDCLATVTITPPIKDYQVDLRIHQDGSELGIETVSGQSDGPTVTVRLFMQLESN